MSDHAFLSRSYDQVSPSGTPVSPPNRITRSDSASYAMAWRHRPGGPGSCGFAFVHSFVTRSGGRARGRGGVLPHVRVEVVGPGLIVQNTRVAAEENHPVRLRIVRHGVGNPS